MASDDSGEILRRVVELATGEIQEIGEHVRTIDTCLRGDAEGKTLGLIARMNAIENECRKNHGSNGNRQVPVLGAASSKTVVWTIDKIILAIATAASILVASFGALTSQCNSRDIRRDRSRWRPRSVEMQDSLDNLPRR